MQDLFYLNQWIFYKYSKTDWFRFTVRCSVKSKYFCFLFSVTLFTHSLSLMYKLKSKKNLTVKIVTNIVFVLDKSHSTKGSLLWSKQQLFLLIFSLYVSSFVQHQTALKKNADFTIWSTKFYVVIFLLSYSWLCWL